MQATRQSPALPLPDLATASIVSSVKWDSVGLQLPTEGQAHTGGIVAPESAVQVNVWHLSNYLPLHP